MGAVVHIVPSSRTLLPRVLALGLAAGLAVAPTAASPPGAHANPAGTGLIISEVGMASLPTDPEGFIELYNPTASDISLNGYSIQHSVVVGANDIVINDDPAALVGTVPAGKTFLITDITESGKSQFIADYVYPGHIGLDADDGVWILASATTSLPRTGDLAGDANVVDAVGVGAKAPGYETAAVSPSTYQQVGRATCTDTDNNSVDFIDGGTRTPRNSTTTDPVCAPPATPECDGQTPTIVAAGTPVEGTDGDDVILGTTGAETINGNGGEDTICALGGADTVNGGEGNDRIFGGLDVDTVSGGAGSDFVRGAAGDDDLVGGDGVDVLKGGPGLDTVSGDVADDLLFGGPGDDTISGGDDNDTINAGAGEDEADGDNGDDLVRGGDDDDVLNGNDGDDRLNGGAGTDTLDGGAGTNVLIP